VIESTGSVVEAWKKSVERGEAIKVTDPEMTRFWLSPSQAVNYVKDALAFESGLIYVPIMPALSIGKLAEFTIGKDVSVERIALRPGEKMHETLVTEEESFRTSYNATNDAYIVYPSTVLNIPIHPYTLLNLPIHS